MKLFTVRDEPIVCAPQWLLVKKPAIGREVRPKEYDLGDMPALFRNFVDLPHDEPDAISDFTSRFGPLGQLESAYAQKDRGDRTHVLFEYGNLWRVAGTDLRLAVLVREAIDRGDRATLQKYFRLHDTDVGGGQVRKEWCFSNHHGGDLLPGMRGQSRVGTHVPTDPYDPVQVDDVLEVASLWLRTTIDFEVGRLCTARFVLDLRSDQEVPSIEPVSLLGALWLQFAWGYALDKRYGQCRACLQWFDPSPGRGGRTARAVFCSDPCKSQDYRKRRDRARTLKAQGVRPSKIASQLLSEGLETDRQTIEQWLKKSGESVVPSKRKTR